MIRVQLIVVPVLTLLLTACGGAEATSEPRLNPDGTTYYCPVCVDDVAWPPDDHLHGVTDYCTDCRARVPVDGHGHRENRWCETCQKPAVWVADVDRWAGRGHVHGETAWCPVCRTDARIDETPESSGEPGSHHHGLTVYCPEEGCKIEVSRRMTPDGSGPSEPAEVAEEHVHVKTTFCPVCRAEVEKDPETGRPSRDHFHKTTRFCKTCGIEAARAGHVHDVTRFCPVCRTEMPIDPGPPDGSLPVGASIVSSPDPSQLGPEAHTATNAEIEEQRNLSRALRDVLDATEAKLEIAQQPLEHNHSVKLAEMSGSPAGSDPVSRFREVRATDESHPTALEGNEALRGQVERILYPSREEFIRKAIKYLERIAVRTDEEESDLEFWRLLLHKEYGSPKDQ